MRIACVILGNLRSVVFVSYILLFRMSFSLMAFGSLLTPLLELLPKRMIAIRWVLTANAQPKLTVRLGACRRLHGRTYISLA